MSLIFHPLVEDDLAVAFEWYELRRDGLGEEFLLAINKAFALIEIHPTIFEVKYAGVRIALIDRFPYSIHFTEFDETIFVTGVWHTAQSPERWTQRI